VTRINSRNHVAALPGKKAAMLYPSTSCGWPVHRVGDLRQSSFPLFYTGNSSLIVFEIFGKYHSGKIKDPTLLIIQLII
jgi:hypothetical protein